MNINQHITEGTAATQNRWTIALAAAVLMLTIGTIYSWDLPQPLLVAFRWDLTVTTGAYAIANFSWRPSVPSLAVSGRTRSVLELWRWSA